MNYAIISNHTNILEQKTEIEEETIEKTIHLTSDHVVDGWDKTFVDGKF